MHFLRRITLDEIRTECAVASAVLSRLPGCLQHVHPMRRDGAHYSAVGLGKLRAIRYAGFMQRKYKHSPPRLDVVFQSFDLPVYFVTFNTHARKHLLASDEIHRAFKEYCGRAGTFDMHVGRYVIMPDHVHLFVGLGNRSDTSLSRWVQGLKRHLHSSLIELGYQPSTLAGQRLRSFWQPGFHDHLLRNDESYALKWDYVKENPVRAGLAISSADWAFQGEITLIDRV